jgi:hypothetical protein
MKEKYSYLKQKSTNVFSINYSTQMDTVMYLACEK